MKKNIFLGLGLYMAIFLEAFYISIPLVFIFLLISFLHYKKEIVLLFAFFAGILLDILTVQIVGNRVLFYILFLFIIFLYKRKFEINTYPFFVIAGGIGLGMYLAFFTHNLTIGTLMGSMGVSLGLFVLTKYAMVKSTKREIL